MCASTVANGPAIQPSPEVVDAILKWSENDRRDLAMLLIDSMRHDLSSLAEAEESQKRLIQSRLDELVNGAETRDVSELFAALDRGIAEARKR